MRLEDMIPVSVDDHPMEPPNLFDGGVTFIGAVGTKLDV